MAKDEGTRYPIPEAELKTRFTYHPPKGDQPDRYVALRDKALELARLICELVPDCRERATALTRLEECSMHANAGIARREDT